MYLTQKEIKDQFHALEKTVAYIKTKEQTISAFLGKAKKIVIFGCGSSFLLAKSAASQLVQVAGIPAYAVAAGDYLVNEDAYQLLIKNAVIISISRSGSTTEILRAVEKAKKSGAAECMSVCAAAGADIAAHVELNLEMPWCFDQSVCQTRTVTNLYAAILLSVALYSQKSDIVVAIEKAPSFFKQFAEKYDEELLSIAGLSWTHAVILADSTVSGLAEEGALAFKEICQCNSNYYHVLDSRHGPMVMIKKDTLVIQFMGSGDYELQQDLQKDIQKKGAVCVVFDCNNSNQAEISAHRIILPLGSTPEVAALYMMYGIQMITYERAMHSNVNPDEPNGLDAWIKLS